jgi:hypothetical protein
MIAAVKRWHAGFSALLFFCAGAKAADDASGAARELARRTAAFAGRGASVVVTWRNLSSLESPAAQARAAFEEALQEAGLRAADSSAVVEVHATVSENASQFLLVEEASKGEEHQVWIAFWKRSDQAMALPAGAALEKKLLWEQAEQILHLGECWCFPPLVSPSMPATARNGRRSGPSPYRRPNPGRPTRAGACV